MVHLHRFGFAAVTALSFCRHATAGVVERISDAGAVLTSFSDSGCKTRNGEQAYLFEFVPSLSHIQGTPVANSELFSVLTSAVLGQGNSHAKDICTVTMASSLSSAYSSYLDGVRSGFDSRVNYVKGLHTKCGVDTFMVTFEPACTSESLTAVFTGGLSGIDKNAIITATFAGVPPAQQTIVYAGTGVALGVRGSLLSLAGFAATACIALIV
ncbi:hypothetical protein NQ176_g1838 [Zarea fungicola]|uniref:Uncharacterized protein n=1 Tax=Zarea fungicola TaxID=93591 RepID=A0ACC1NRK8_9HYPO|nr:hypothetical protein NQ176_g1838 [Lecanicillium fungicola]